MLPWIWRTRVTAPMCPRRRGRRWPASTLEEVPIALFVGVVREQPRVVKLGPPSSGRCCGRTNLIARRSYEWPRRRCTGLPGIHRYRAQVRVRNFPLLLLENLLGGAGPRPGSRSWRPIRCPRAPRRRRGCRRATRIFFPGGGRRGRGLFLLAFSPPAPRAAPRLRLRRDGRLGLDSVTQPAHPSRTASRRACARVGRAAPLRRSRAGIVRSALALRSSAAAASAAAAGPP